MIGKNFLQFVCCLFTLFMVSFEIEIFLIWKKPDLFNFSFVACIFGVIYKKFLKPRSWRFSCMFSFKSFIFSCYITGLDPLWLNFCKCYELTSSFIFYMLTQLNNWTTITTTQTSSILNSPTILTKLRMWLVCICLLCLIRETESSIRARTVFCLIHHRCSMNE